jgi:hypothetical protein
MLRNDGTGEQMIRLRVAVKTRHRTSPGEQNHQRQNNRPGRGENTPTADTPVDAFLREPRVDAIEHDLPRYVAPQQIYWRHPSCRSPRARQSCHHIPVIGLRAAMIDPARRPPYIRGKAAQEACA